MIHEQRRDFGADDLCAEAQNLGVVRLLSPLSRIRIGNGGCPHARHLAGGDRHADPRPAHEDGPLRLPGRDFPSDLDRDVRVVDLLERVAPVVVDIVSQSVKCSFTSSFIS